MKAVFLFSALTLLLGASVQSAPTLDPLFGDHAVLLADAPIVIRGSAIDESEIEVHLAGHSVKAPVRDGRWEATLPALPAGGPHEIVVKGDGVETRSNDILIGEVWLCSGQSNIEQPLGPFSHTPQGTVGWKEEAAVADFPLIREFKVKPAFHSGKTQSYQGEWKVCTPKNVPKFSAAGYYMAKALHTRLDGAPIGIINSSLGGTIIQAWMSPAALAAVPGFSNAIQVYEKSVLDAQNRRKEFEASRPALMTQHEKAKAAAVANGKPAPRPPQPPLMPPGHRRPSSLYNGMIEPLQAVPVRGIAWYQGESNSEREEDAVLYGPLLTALIADWRREWDAPSLPILIVELAPHPRWKEPVRAMQLDAAAQLAPSALIKSDDIIDRSIHPPLKRPTGERLAAAAFALVYSPDSDPGERVVLFPAK